MLRLERIKQYMLDLQKAAAKQESGTFGATASQVASDLGIWRNDVSTYLNELVRDGFLIKHGKRPALFSVTPGVIGDDEIAAKPRGDAARNGFERMIGSNGSLQLQCELAKAAASYPPSGMHTLIIGETGVGKSLMAEEIWRYMANLRGVDPSDVQYVVFNCAEYANNPQLLLSHLFGHEKGAFTGADSARNGLIEAANGGVLLLDEIHRLPAEGQELLFTVIDKGVFRRLGSSAERKVQLMIIGATTEDPESALLPTFRRRLPMLIQIPSLNDRPIKERTELVLMFLSQEANRLDLPIKVTNQALKVMASFRSEGNIGDLKNKIQIICAKSYMSCLDSAKGERKPVVTIDVYNLSRIMITNYQVQDNIEKYFAAPTIKNGLIVHPGKNPPLVGDEQFEISRDFYKFVIDQMSAGHDEHGQGKPSRQSAIKTDLCHRKIAETNSLKGFNILFSSVSADVWLLTTEIMQMATDELKREFPQSTYNSIAFFLQQTQAYAKAGSVFNVAIDSSMQNFAAEKALVGRLIPAVNDRLGVQLMDEEANVLALLLAQYSQQKKEYIGLVVVAHGSNVATSIANFTNELLGTDLVIGVDAPIRDDPQRVTDNLCKAISSCANEKGVIVLSEINAYLSMGKAISGRTKAKCRVLPMMHNTMVLETCNAIMTTDYPIDKIVSNIMQGMKKYLDFIFKSCEGQTGESAQGTAKSVVITFCVTGMGSAKIAQRVLQDNPLISSQAEVLSMGMIDDIHAITDGIGNRLKLIVGFIDPHIPGVPFIGMENLLTQAGLNRIAILLQKWNADDNSLPENFGELPLERQLRYVARNIGHFAPSLDTEAASAQALRVVETISSIYGANLEPDRIVRLYIHTAAMFERLATRVPMDMPPYAEETIQKNRALFERIKELLNNACTPLSLTASDAEAYFLLILLIDLDCGPEFL